MRRISGLVFSLYCTGLALPVGAAAAADGNAIMFVNQSKCPRYWTVAADAQGRLIEGTVPVEQLIGRKLGPAGNAGPATAHAHGGTYKTLMRRTKYRSRRLPGAAEAAERGTAGTATQDWLRAVWPSRDWPDFDPVPVHAGGDAPLLSRADDALPYVQYSVCRFPAGEKLPRDRPGPRQPTDTTLPEALPKWSIAFFDKPACPADWEWYEKLLFKTPLPMRDDGELEAVVLSGSHGNGHEHGVPAETAKQAEFFLPDNPYPGTNPAYQGEDGHLSLAAANEQSFSIQVDEEMSMLPAIRYLPCIKKYGSETGKRENLPDGLLSFFALKSCPRAWTDHNIAKGRFVLGLPPDGVNGDGFGGPALRDKEVRGHTHAIPAGSRDFYAKKYLFRTIWGGEMHDAVQAAAGHKLLLPKSARMSGEGSLSPSYLQLKLCMVDAG